MLQVTDPPDQLTAFHHEAFLYAGADEYVAGAVPYILAGLEAGVPVLVAVSRAKQELLRSALGRDAARVEFADMAVLGRNPARIIPVWQDFIAAHAGRPVRGIGEPVWPGRTADEVVECQHHESLINLAFADAPAWSLLCPYDTEHIPPEVVEAARRNHPHVLQGGVTSPSDLYEHPHLEGAPFHGALAPPPPDADQLAFGIDELRAVRELVAARAVAAGLPASRVADAVLATSELAANSVRHGGGRGLLRVWIDGRDVVCEVCDAGSIRQPLVGRVRPDVGSATGRGLWMVNYLCDLAQIRVVAGGTVVRVRLSAE